MTQFEEFKALIDLRSGNGFEVRPEAKVWNGRIVKANPVFEIEGRSQYNGEWACLVEGFPKGWIASGDLKELGK